MGDFVNYTPGEYAKEHIRITPTTLADGRDFFYLDDDPEYVSGVKTRELKDPRQLPYRFSNQLNAAGEEVPYAAPEMRRDPLTGDWIPMATARMNRPITAGPGATAKGNPLAARKPGDPYQDGEVPDTDYNVVVFENRFPSMVRVPGRSEAVEYVNGNPLWEKKLAAGRCEVICFDPDEDGLPADLPVSRLRTVVEAWAFRTAEISKMEGIEQIFPFENHGQEIGVSLAHPHGQVYCYPFIAPKMEAELKQTEAYHEKTGGNLLKDLMNAEIEAGERIVMRNHSWVAYVPAAARWPLEVHVAPVRDVLTLDELNDQERWDLAVMYSTLLKRGNAFFDKGDGKGMDLPYIAAWHQAPIHDKRRENYRLNLQFFSFRRAANKIKYLAGSESGMAAWVSDRCEVICFDPDEDGLPADLPVSRLRTVVEAWAFRTAEISKMEGIEQIFPFENHGQEIGVSLAHPHGQVYCYPFIAPKMEAELKQTEAYHEKTGGNLLKDLMNAEIEAGERIVMRNHSWVAYVPAAARWPLEVHVAPVRDVLTLDELNDQERWDLAVMYSTLLKRGNAFFDKGDGKGMDLPYIAAWHQAPIHDKRRENYRLNLQFFSFRRAANKIKYLAGSESGMAAWVSDTTPELIAKRFHELGPIDIEG